VAVAMDCMVSPLRWTVGRTAPPSATGLSISAVVGLKVLVATFREEFLFADSVIVKSVAAPVECPSSLPKIIYISICKDAQPDA
jgi:hypothetical protein